MLTSGQRTSASSSASAWHRTPTPCLQAGVHFCKELFKKVRSVHASIHVGHLKAHINSHCYLLWQSPTRPPLLRQKVMWYGKGGRHRFASGSSSRALAANAGHGVAERGNMHYVQNSNIFAFWRTNPRRSSGHMT